MATNSRYDFMTNGTTLDEVSGSYYPDPLSINYSNLKLSSVPIKDVMTSTNIPFLWREADNYYGKPCWDDMVLILNGVSHKNFIRPGDILYFPKEDDILASFDKER